MNLSACVENNIACWLNIHFNWWIWFVKFLQTCQQFFVIFNIGCWNTHFQHWNWLTINGDEGLTLFCWWEGSWFENMLLKVSNPYDVSSMSLYYSIRILAMENIKIIYFHFLNISYFNHLSIFFYFLLLGTNYQNLVSSFETTWK